MSRFSVRRILRGSRRLRGDEDGAALLEMTIVTPFLVIFGLGLFEFSNALYQYHLITGGIRDAARYAASLPIPTVIDQNQACDASDPRATPIGCAKRLALTGQVAAGGGQRVGWWESGDIEITYPSFTNETIDGLRQYRGPDNITRVVVTTTFVYEGIGFFGALGLNPFTVTTAHEERHYGVR
jgi:hypothetical protein